MNQHVKLIQVFLLFFAFNANAQIENNILKQANLHVHNSDRFMRAHLWDSAQLELNRLSILSKTHPSVYISGLETLQKGVLEKNLSNYDKAVKKLNSAYDIFTTLGNDTLQGIAMNHLGQVYRFMDLKEMTRESYRTAWSHMVKTNNYRQQSFTLSNMANYFKKNKELDSAKYYYETALTLKKKHGVSGKSNTINNLAGVFSMMGNPEKASDMYLEAIELAKTEKDSSFIAYPMIELGVINIEAGNYSKALVFLNQASRLNLDSKLQMRYLSVMSYLHEKQGNYQEALAWKNNYLELYKEHLNEIQTKSIQELNVKYETERKNSALERQKLEIAVQKKNIDLKSTQIVLLILGLLVLILVTYLIVQRIQKRGKTEKLKARFEGEKSIKTSIGRNLHDFVAPELNAVRIKLETQQLKNPSSDTESIIKQLRETTQNVRDMSHQLSPMIYRLEVAPFRTIIENSLIEFQRYTNIEVSMNKPFPASLDEMEEHHQENVYGIILESLNNIRRHSKAKNIAFSITEKSKMIHMKITDDGIGFKPNKKSGIGIQNMKNRAELLRGSFSIESNDSGCSLVLTFPKL